MSTHNICFCQEIRKILCGYPLLSVAMIDPEQMLSLHYSLKAVCPNTQHYYDKTIFRAFLVK